MATVVFSFCPYCGRAIRHEDSACDFCAAQRRVLETPAVGYRRYDCRACGTASSVVRIETPRFSPALRLAGTAFAAFSVIGVLAATSRSATASGGVETWGMFLTNERFVALMMSLMDGLVGCWLISKRRLFRCQACSFAVDRAPVD